MIFLILLYEMDILVLETLSTSDKNDIALHRIEIKVSKHELLEIRKWHNIGVFAIIFGLLSLKG
ncbi:MAG: hypothetical protein NC177_12850 [Ruminococcus flavefaciens]|nr:hypothetical protein [Ruminococcus flavefaciens]